MILLRKLVLVLKFKAIMIQWIKYQQFNAQLTSL